MKRVAFIVLLICISMAVEQQSAAETFHEGIFQISIPPSWTRLPSQELDQFLREMVSGARELAETSNTARPSDISKEAIPFMSGF